MHPPSAHAADSDSIMLIVSREWPIRRPERGPWSREMVWRRNVPLRHEIGRIGLGRTRAAVPSESGIPVATLSFGPTRRSSDEACFTLKVRPWMAASGPIGNAETHSATPLPSAGEQDTPQRKPPAKRASLKKCGHGRQLVDPAKKRKIPPRHALHERGGTGRSAQITEPADKPGSVVGQPFL